MKKIALLFLLFISPAAFSDIILCTGMSNTKLECADWIKNNSTGHEIINGAIGGKDIVTIHNNPDSYWDGVMKMIAEAGRTPEDIDIIWNKNATRAESRNLVTERQLVHDYFIWFQTIAEVKFPNLKAGYHSPRTSGEFCDLNPEPYAGDVKNAIRGIGDSSGAISHFDKWHFGPDVSAPDFVRSDYSDGCHPGARGLQKVTPILNAFFGDDGSTPNPNPSGPVTMVSNLGRGSFVINWSGQGSTLTCSGSEFPVSGESHTLKIPADLPYGSLHQCAVDHGKESNKFGCRSSRKCVAR